MNITFEVDTNFELDLTLVYDVKEEPYSIASFHCLANAGECSPLTLTIHTPKMAGDGESTIFLCQCGGRSVSAIFHGTGIAILQE